MKRISDHTWEVTEPTSIQVGRPKNPPSPEALRQMREAVASLGATSIYWFWVSVDGDRPHLGLAVSPPEVVSSIGRALEPIWQEHSPHNAKLDVFRLGDAKLDGTFRANGESLL
jgi:hypothetical protein